MELIRGGQVNRFVMLRVCVLLVGLLSTGCDRRVDVDFNYAFETENYEWARALLDEGADIDARFIQADGYTTLIMAAKSDRNPEGIEWLLEQGADPDVPSFNGRTALYVAASAGRVRHVEILLASGADVNARNETPLLAAHDNGHKIIERMIREAGGDY